MAILFDKVGPIRDGLTLDDAERENLEWDVFVSHKSDDIDEALSVAKCIRSFDLTAWVDVLDPNIGGDALDLDNYIERVMFRSFSLMAVVTDVTHQSWWVPFEIGIAFELRRYLASYTERLTELPSFLEKRPRITNHIKLHEWCEKIKELKQKPRTDNVYLADGLTFLKANSADTYRAEMQNMARMFR